MTKLHPSNRAPQRATPTGNTAAVCDALSLATRDTFHDRHWSFDDSAARRSRVLNQPRRKLRASRQAFYDSL